ANSTEDILQQVESYSLEMEEPLEADTEAQFTGASKFTDVSPGDWAFQALDDLVRRYDCLKGYPNGTYRGNRALTRYEFAAGLNACLQQIERLIAETTADFVTREELETLRRLMQEFEAELATLGTRVDNLEGRVAFLEDNQFSTTTKLVGEVIFNLDIATGRRAKIYGLDDADYNDLSELN
ncbi:MAG: iron uptake porin, partial [Spirulinaceae cyanobacterium]